MTSDGVDRWERSVPLAGGHNFRDFGGYPTTGGARVRRGLLFRSGSMSRVDAADRERLRVLGAKSICDLRTIGERRNDPTVWHDPDVSDLLAHEHDHSGAALGDLLADPGATREDAVAAMVALYRALPFVQAPGYRLVFRRLAERQVPLVVNCAAGKDRTGVAVALILRTLGVAPALVEEDYLLTNTALDVDRLLAGQGDFAARMRARPDMAAAVMRADPAYLAAAFAAIDERYGTLAAYLSTELGMNEADLRAVEATLLIDR